MKALLGLSVLAFSSIAMADTIYNMDDCNLALRKSNPWKNKYTLNGSRVTGKAADAYSKMYLKSGAVTETVKDVLGVARYNVVTLVTNLEADGSSVDSCEGISYANRVDVCTLDQTVKVCETYCSFEWRGMDCR